MTGAGPVGPGGAAHAVMSSAVTRDSDRSKVYLAEDACFVDTLFTEPLGMAGVADLAARLFADAWWVAHVGRRPTIEVTRRDARRSYADTAGQVIRFDLASENCAVLVHEAAHVATAALFTAQPVATHGREFRAVLVDLTTLTGGRVAAARLMASFRDHRLDLVDRHWPEPVPAHERGLYGRWRLDRTV